MKYLVKIIAALFVASYCLAEETYYTWVDENGVVNYAEKAPLDRDYEEYSEGRSKRSFGYPVQKREEPAPPPPTNIAVSDDPNDIVTSRNCQAAQEAMKKLTEFKQVILKDDDGIWREASEERKREEIAIAQEAIDEFCP